MVTDEGVKKLRQALPKCKSLPPRPGRGPNQGDREEQLRPGGAGQEAVTPPPGEGTERLRAAWHMHEAYAAVYEPSALARQPAQSNRHGIALEHLGNGTRPAEPRRRNPP